MLILDDRFGFITGIYNCSRYEIHNDRNVRTDNTRMFLCNAKRHADEGKCEILNITFRIILLAQHNDMGNVHVCCRSNCRNFRYSCGYSIEIYIDQNEGNGLLCSDSINILSGGFVICSFVQFIEMTYCSIWRMTRKKFWLENERRLHRKM